jgi:hypothetical protein
VVEHVHPGQAEQLVVALRSAAQELLDRHSIRDLQQTLSEIVAAAVETVPGATAGGISVTEDGIVDSRNPTSRGISELDRLQAELHEGPCITALESPAEDGVVVAEDLAGDDGRGGPGSRRRRSRRGSGRCCPRSSPPTDRCVQR